MVFVKVRETYDLHTIKNKMTVIGIHTPGATIIKENYPGLLLQCKAYRPVKCDVKLACASVLPLDPQGVGLADGDVAPEDIFNPILYKALSNFGMSNLDKFVLNGLAGNGSNSLDFDNDIDFQTDVGAQAQTSVDQFDIYYGLLAQTHEWKHANPQSGLRMDGLVPLVYEVYQSIGDNSPLAISDPNRPANPFGISEAGTAVPVNPVTFRGKAHSMPMLNCTGTIIENVEGVNYPVGANPAFGGVALNFQCGIPAPKVFCGCIIVPPSRLHQLFYRLVCEWTLEFSMIRPYGDLVSWQGLASIGDNTHYISYSYDAKTTPATTSMVDTSEDSEIHKVM